MADTSSSFGFWFWIASVLETCCAEKNFYLRSYSCVLCNANVEETLDHLFFECTFSAWCWSFVGVTWDNSLPILERLQAARAALGSPIFMKIVILTACCIWSVRNKVIFDSASPSLGQWKHNLLEELFLSLFKCKSSKKCLLQAWLALF